jgi:hypothetical protein
MLFFILAVVAALTRKIPPKPPEDSLEAINPSILEGNNSTGRFELLSVIAADSVVCRRPLQTRRLNHLSYYKPHTPGLDNQASPFLFPLMGPVFSISASE